MKTLYVKYSTQRNEQYQIMTSILRDDQGSMLVRKEPACSAAFLHLDRINENSLRISKAQDVFKMPASKYTDHVFETEYITGDTFEQELLSLFTQKHYKEAEAKWIEYKELLGKLPLITCNPSQNEDFRNLFGDTERIFSCVEIGHIDLITENIIRSKDGTLWNIDPEWILDAPVPVDFIAYRAVVIFYNKYQSVLPSEYNENTILDFLKIGGNKGLFMDWEKKFSQSILSDSIYAMQQKYFVPTHDFAEWSAHLPTVFISTVYYGNDRNFSEERCIKAELKNDPKTHVSFHFPQPQTVSLLRWDPCEGVFPAMSSLRFELKLNRQIVSVYDVYETNALLLQNKHLFLTTDPQVMIALPEPVTIDEVVIDAELELNAYRDLDANLIAPVNRKVTALISDNSRLDQQNASLITDNSRLNLQVTSLVSENGRKNEENRALQQEIKKISEESRIYREETAISISHLTAVNNNLQESSNRMHRSLSFKLTRPFRMCSDALRRLKNPLSARRSADLVPASAIARTDAGTFHATGEDPQLFIHRKFRKGIYLFFWDGAATRRTQLKVYFDYGRGFNEIDTTYIGYINQDFIHHEKFLRVKQNASRIRLDPGEKGHNTISLSDFSYLRLGILSGIRVGVAMIAGKTGDNKIRLLLHLIKLYLTGGKHEVKSHFASIFKDHGDGKLSDRYEEAYQQYMTECEPDEEDLSEQIRNASDFRIKPLISVIVPVYNTNREMLIEMIESVRSQTYPNWQLCLADGNSSKEHVAGILNDYAAKDSRIKVKLLTENFGIAGNTNAALDLASGDYIALLDHDDLLPRWALYSVVSAINSSNEPDVLYSDEDKITFDGATRFFPHFKPDWSPDLLRSYNYITHLFVAKRALVSRAGNFLPGYDGSQDHDLILRTTELAEQIVHIPQILYHWRSHAESTAESQGNKSYTLEAGVKAISAHLERKGLPGTVEFNQKFGSYRVNYKLTAEPLVSIIIPNFEHIAELRCCIESIFKLTTYKNFEVIVVENNSSSKDIFAYYEQIQKAHGVRVIHWEGQFNYSAINNFAVRESRGEILLFMNNDTEVIAPDWIEQMLQYAQRQDVGAVGAKLYYADDTIQHAGVILGFRGLAGHAFLQLPKDEPGYMGRAMVAQNVSAVTAACMMMRKGFFDSLSGFDETLKVAFNDIDLCMKIRQAGKLIVYTPYAELYHHESVSRGAEDTEEKKERFVGEIEYFHSKWKDQLDAGDPYYNPHLDLELTPYRISGK